MASSASSLFSKCCCGGEERMAVETRLMERGRRRSLSPPVAWRWTYHEAVVLEYRTFSNRPKRLEYLP